MKTRNYILFAILSLLSLSSCGIVQDSSSATPSSTSQETTTSATSSSSPSSSQRESSSSDVESSSSASSSQRESSSSDVDSSSSEEYSSSDYSYSSSSEQSSSLEPSSSSEEQSSSEQSSSSSPEQSSSEESSSSSPEESSSEESSSSSEESSSSSEQSSSSSSLPPVINEYTITWKDENGTVLDTDIVTEGTTPSYTGTTPSKAKDDYYVYSFNKWNPSIAKATADATYTASYSKKAHTLYFTNNQNWGDLKAYAWGGTGEAMSWPGKSMSYYRSNEFSQPIFSIDGMDKYENVIFNGNGGQTVDISLKNLGDHNAFFPNGEKESTKFKVTSLQEKTSDTLRILHCFDWSISTILENLDDIANQGFNAIQTSPLQAAKDYPPTPADNNDKWWRYYQPVSLSVANKNSSVLFSSLDGNAELKTLTSEAKKRGIKVIVDVVVNHLGDGDGNGGLHKSVGIYEPQIYNNTSNTLHNYGSTNDDSIAAIVKGDPAGKDLNTSNNIVQQRVLAFFKELIDDGVSGFRFDATKHIETPDEQDGCASSFWTNTLGAAKTYAASKNITLFSYGEILNPAGNTGKRSYSQYIYSAGLDAVTDSIIGEKYRDGGTSGYWTGLDSNHNVIWGESHDDYLGDAHITSYTSQEHINNVYDKLARDKNGAILLYFARPNLDAPIGSIDEHPDWGWKSDFIRKANIAHH